MDYKDKLKSLIQKLINKASSLRANNTPKEPLNIERSGKKSYKYLNTTTKYDHASDLRKVWYLRGRFDWFDDLIVNDEDLAYKHADMLLEIAKELGEIAYAQPTMDEILKVLCLKFNVEGLYNQFTKGENLDEDYTDFEYSFNLNNIELIWMYRALYDDAKNMGNVKLMKYVIGELKTIRKKIKERNKVDKAISDITEIIDNIRNEIKIVAAVNK